MTGMDRYEDKKRREWRRRNHIARDLRSPLFRQRIKKGRPKPPPPEVEDFEYDD